VPLKRSRGLSPVRLSNSGFAASPLLSRCSDWRTKMPSASFLSATADVLFAFGLISIAAYDCPRFRGTATCSGSITTASRGACQRSKPLDVLGAESPACRSGFDFGGVLWRFPARLSRRATASARVSALAQTLPRLPRLPPRPGAQVVAVGDARAVLDDQGTLGGEDVGFIASACR